MRITAFGMAVAAATLCLAAPVGFAAAPAFDAALALSGRGELVATQDDVSPRVAAAEATGVMVAAWHAAPKDMTVRADNDVFIARSTDGGSAWAEPVHWPDRSSGAVGDARFPAIATDGAGTWIVVWESTDSLGGTLRTDKDILFVRSSDDGATWTEPAALARHASRDWGDDIRPKIASDSADGWLVVWSSRDPLRNQLGGDFDVLYSRSSDDGLTWSDPAAIHDNAASDSGFDIEPSITMGAGPGSWHVVWSSNSALKGGINADTDILLVSSTDSGSTWTSPAQVNNNADSDRGADIQPQIAGRPGGELIAVWTSADTLKGEIGMDRDIVVARSADSGETWTDPKPLSLYEAGDAHHDAAPQVIASGEKDWFVAWHSWNTLLSEMAAGPPDGPSSALYSNKVGGDTDIFLARSSDGGLSWSVPVAVDAAAGHDLAEDLYPHLTTAGSGKLLIVWQAINRRGLRDRVDRDILVSVGEWLPSRARDVR